MMMHGLASIKRIALLSVFSSALKMEMVGALKPLMPLF
jgi:hypothetical protein